MTIGIYLALTGAVFHWIKHMKTKMMASAKGKSHLFSETSALPCTTSWITLLLNLEQEVTVLFRDDTITLMIL